MAKADSRNNVYIGNVTANGVKKTNGGLTLFNISMYNGKDAQPFFLRVKAFGNTKIAANLTERNRVLVKGNLRVDRWTKTSIDEPEKPAEEIELWTVYADAIEDCPWEDNSKIKPAFIQQSAGSEQVPF